MGSRAARTQLSRTTSRRKAYRKRLLELAARDGASREERLRRLRILPIIARSVEAITGWSNASRCLQIADVIYHWHRARDLRGDNRERQQRLIESAWCSVIRWKLCNEPERVTETERALLGARGVAEGDNVCV